MAQQQMTIINWVSKKIQYSTKTQIDKLMEDQMTAGLLVKTNLKSTDFLKNPRHHLSRPWSSPLRGTATNDFNYSGLTKTSSVYSMCFENYCFFSMTSIKELELHSQRDAFAHWSNTLKVYFSKKDIPL